MEQNTAWVTITGKVFVQDWEMAERLRKNFPDRVKTEIEEDSATQAVDVTPEEYRDAFKEIAREKINELFLSDEPVKMNEIEIDMETFR